MGPHWPQRRCCVHQSNCSQPKPSPLHSFSPARFFCPRDDKGEIYQSVAYMYFAGSPLVDSQLSISQLGKFQAALAD